MCKSVNAQTQTQPEHFQANHSRRQSSNSTSLPSYAKPAHSYNHCLNKRYTADERLFIQSERDDKNTPWKIVAEKYNRAFPDYYRTRSSLEACYYRERSEPKGNTDREHNGKVGAETEFLVIPEQKSQQTEKQFEVTISRWVSCGEPSSLPTWEVLATYSWFFQEEFDLEGRRRMGGIKIQF
ncbi:hypothetical protein V493_01045 [Pseudogymnoascus sp. VKM F-4281 (FW-2241)]|nr:hypothetical protein V493_01045 [Pseudogymnoascus sp. VKM F-4281 (FW-2241)]